MAATTAISTREVVEAVKKVADRGSFGVDLGVSASKTTGASKIRNLTHELYALVHFQPLLSTSYA